MPIQKSIQAVAIIANNEKPEVLARIPSIIKAVRKRRISVLLEKDVATLSGFRGCAATDLVMKKKAGLVVVLGGDGTFLHAASVFQGTGIPMLGLNFGMVGFLNIFESSRFGQVLNRILDGRYETESRMMLMAEVNGRPVPMHALNEMTITRSRYSRALTLKCRINGRYVWSYKSDGIIIATPTGSTAYSLSSHGPIIEPGLESIIINPICPHTLAARAMIVRPDGRISIGIDPRETGDVRLAVDGRDGTRLKAGDEVVIMRSGRSVELVTSEGRDFFGLLGGKLGWLRS